jgi:hypothetical protein
MGIAPGVNTEFWEEKGQDFCKDLVKWTSLLLSDTAPSVNSVSYGWQGAMTQIQCLPNEWYGARFSTEICIRGCHWFPRLLN